MDAGDINGTGWYEVRTVWAGRFVEQSETRDFAFWEDICRDLKEAQDDLSRRGHDESIRRAFSKLSHISRELWRKSGVEPLYGR